MQIQNVHVKNFRSILNESLPCDSLTALVGRNGSGKSSFLSALELFYNPAASVTPEDFYAEDVTQDIEIAVTYKCLNAEAKDFFSAYIDNDSLTVVRVFSDPQSGKSSSYHGMRLQNPDFVDIRKASAAMDKRNKYNEIRGKGQYEALPSVNSADAVLRELDDWETQNPKHCKHQGIVAILWIHAGRSRISWAIHEVHSHTSCERCTGRCNGEKGVICHRVNGFGSEKRPREASRG